MFWARRVRRQARVAAMHMLCRVFLVRSTSFLDLLTWRGASLILFGATHKTSHCMTCLAFLFSGSAMQCVRLGAAPISTLSRRIIRRSRYCCFIAAVDIGGGERSFGRFRLNCLVQADVGRRSRLSIRFASDHSERCRHAFGILGARGICEC